MKLVQRADEHDYGVVKISGVWYVCKSHMGQTLAVNKDRKKALQTAWKAEREAYDRWWATERASYGGRHSMYGVSTAVLTGPGIDR